MAAVRQLDVSFAEQVAGRAGGGGVPHLRLVRAGGSSTCSQRRQAVIYRRRRLAVALAVVVCSVALVRWVSPLLGDPAAAPSEAGIVHIVQPGDTYWSIASSLDTGGDITGTVDALSSSHDGRLLQVGDRLVLPG